MSNLFDIKTKQNQIKKDEIDLKKKNPKEINTNKKRTTIERQNKWKDNLVFWLT